jgi:hypothetical protein
VVLIQSVAWQKHVDEGGGGKLKAGAALYSIGQVQMFEPVGFLACMRAESAFGQRTGNFSFTKQAHKSNVSNVTNVSRYL